MNDPVPPAPSLNGTGEPEVRLLDLAAVLLRSWKTLVLCTLLGAAAAAAMALTQPRSYTTRVVVVPSVAEGEGRAQLLAAQLNIPLLGRMGGTGQNQSLIEAIVRSRSLKDSIALRVAPRANAQEKGRLAEILRQTAIRSNPQDRSVTIEVTAPDPRLAARLANEFPDAINEIATRIAVETAQKKGAALETQLTAAAERLARSEEALRNFEKESGAPAVEEQARASVEAAAELQRAVTEAELRVGQLARVYTPDNPRYQAAVADLAARRQQLARITSGGGALLGQSQLPDVKMGYTRLYRDFKRDEQIFVSLTASLASAQADANQDMAVVTALDTALVPEAPSGPRVKLMVMVGMFFGGLLGLVAAFVREFMRRARHDPESEPFFEAWDGFKGDFTRLAPGRRSAAPVTPAAPAAPRR
ncbi:MAG TPA: GNVR domain-containing protein [Longimicrobium sp.]|nr:GNVR domain-containing protein [Longimicrobium sp.]